MFTRRGHAGGDQAEGCLLDGAAAAPEVETHQVGAAAEGGELIEAVVGQAEVP